MRGSKPIIDAALLKIVHYEVRAFTGRSPLRKSEPGKQAAIIDDLFSAGTEALMRAVEGFDPALGHAFKTYASRCVRHAIWRTARPRKRDALSRELVRLDAPIQADDGLTTQHDIVPDGAGDALPVPNAFWRCLFGKRRRFGGQAELRIVHRGVTYRERAPGERYAHQWWRKRSPGVEAWRCLNNDSGAVRGLIPDRDFDVLLSCHAGYKRREIAKRLGVSTERVRQIRLRAVETVKRLYQTDATLRLAIDAPHFYQAQVSEAQHVLRAHRPSPSFWAHRASLRQLEAEARLYRAILPTGRPISGEPANCTTYSRDPADWTDALVVAARLAMLELGMKLPIRKLKGRTENVQQTTNNKRGRRNPPRFEAAA